MIKTSDLTQITPAVSAMQRRSSPPFEMLMHACMHASKRMGERNRSLVTLEEELDYAIKRRRR